MIDPKVEIQTRKAVNLSGALLYAGSGEIGANGRLLIPVAVCGSFVLAGLLGMLGIVDVGAPTGDGPASSWLLALFVLIGLAFFVGFYRAAAIREPVFVLLSDQEFCMTSVTFKKTAKLGLGEIKSVEMVGPDHKLGVNINTTRWHSLASHISPFRNRRVGPVVLSDGKLFAQLLASEADCPLKRF